MSRLGPHHRRRRVVLVIGVVLVLVLAGFGAFRSTDTGHAAIPGVPDVTGAGTKTGSISIAAIRAQAPGVTVSALTLNYGGLNRGYLLLTPTAATAPLPLIVVLHGVNASVTQEVERDELLPLVTAGEVALVYPAGYDQSWNVGVDGCCGTAPKAGVDDIGFVAAIVGAAGTRVAVAPGRTYLIGFSNGGKLAYQVMCDEPTLFTAFAVVSAVPLATCAEAAQPARPVLIAVGASDPELPSAAQPVAAARALAGAVSTWRTRDGCPATGSTVTSGSATITTWRGCTDATMVTSVLYAGLVHLWPTAALVGSAQPGASLIWAFFGPQTT